MVLKQQLRKKTGRKGFTLIEVIVVLVILAILAAIAVPALTGYINKANNRAVVSEARNIYVALQAIATDQYGQGTAVAASYDTGSEALPDGKTIVASINELTDGTYVGSEITDIKYASNKITEFVWTHNGNEVTFKDGKYTVA